MTFFASLLVGFVTAAVVFSVAVLLAALSYLVLVVLAWREQMEDWPGNALRGEW